MTPVDTPIDKIVKKSLNNMQSLMSQDKNIESMAESK